MTTTNWIIDIALVLLVVLQIREQRLTPRFALLPAGIVAFSAHKFLHSVPTGGNNLLLLAGCVAAGAALGALGGLITRVRAQDGVAYVRAGWAAATLWIASMGARLGFIIWITHGSGAAALAQFSAAHGISGPVVWQDALVLLALAEVVVRFGVIGIRGLLLTQHHEAPTAPGRRPGQV